MEDEKCPKCGEEMYRDEVDVEVGVICGPWGCGYCGWSSDPRYDCSGDKESPAQSEHPEWYVDQWGGMTRKSALKERLGKFGIGPEVVDDVFGPEPEKQE